MIVPLLIAAGVILLVAFVIWVFTAPTMPPGWPHTALNDIPMPPVKPPRSEGSIPSVALIVARDLLDTYRIDHYASAREGYQPASADELAAVIDQAFAPFLKSYNDLHAANRAQVEANIARARPLGEASSHYALHNPDKLNAPYGALEMAFIRGANWQKESGS